jgi:hypothetical protein
MMTFVMKNLKTGQNNPTETLQENIPTVCQNCHCGGNLSRDSPFAEEDMLLGSLAYSFYMKLKLNNYSNLSNARID